MEFYGWIALFVLIAILVRSFVKWWKRENRMEAECLDFVERVKDSKEETGDSREVGGGTPPGPVPAAPAPQSPLDMPIDKYLVYLLLGGVAICAGLWIYGCADAASDVQNGLNMLTYRMKLSNMNLISRQGYKYYIENNTDMPQREREVQQKMEKLDKEMEKLDKLFNP